MLTLTILVSDSPIHILESDSCIGQGPTLQEALVALFNYNEARGHYWFDTVDQKTLEQYYSNIKLQSKHVTVIY